MSLAKILQQFKQSRSAIVISVYDESKPRCACLYDIIQDGTEKSDERKTKTCQSSPYAQDTQD